jgi:hypothetical protein
MTIERINEHPVLRNLEGQWEKIAMIIMHTQGLKEFKLTPEVIQKFSDAYAPGLPCMIAEGLGPTGEEIVSLRIVTEAEARKLAARQRA